jgi:hypothetical protein
MRVVSDNTVEIVGLVNDLESWNAHNVRLEAAKKLGKIGCYNKLAIDALQRAARDSYTELGRAAQESIDAIYLSGQMKKPVMKQRTLLTSVEITPEGGQGLEVESTKAFCWCNFCGKETIVNQATRRFTDKLSGPERFYCTFCLRHRLNQRDARHTLMLSFRGIIGYYYYAFYAQTKQVHMCVSEIVDYVNLHVQAGQQNPLFIYDPETFLWFVDFTRVGKSKRKLPIQDVLATVGEILLAFNLHDCVKDIKPHKMYLKYEEAIIKFYHQRHRPAGARVLSPTLFKTGASEYAAERLAKDSHWTTSTTTGEKKKIDFEATRNFMPAQLHEAMGKKY